MERLKLHCRSRSTVSTKISTYLDMNPDLVLPGVYCSGTYAVLDYASVIHSLPSVIHSLQTLLIGYVSKPDGGVEPPANNVYVHVTLQDAYHVLFQCPKTSELRLHYGLNTTNNNWNYLFNNSNTNQGQSIKLISQYTEIIRPLVDTW